MALGGTVRERTQGHARVDGRAIAASGGRKWGLVCCLPRSRGVLRYRPTGSVSTGDLPLPEADCSENRKLRRLSDDFDVRSSSAM
jgi:hypothetical protein